MIQRRVLSLAAGLALTLLALPARAGDELPGVKLGDLEPAEAQALTQLLKEGACPCDPGLSLYECIKAKSCERATTLGQFGATKLGQGFSIDQVREAVVHKYLDEFVSYSFDLKDRPFEGSKNGRIVLVEFADFQCPHCALLSQVLKQIVAAYPRDVHLVYKSFPLRMPGLSEVAARAGWAAQQQGRFWPMHDLIFEHQGTLTDAKLKSFATELGLNLGRFEKDRNSDAARAYVLADRAEGSKANITGTPTLFINGKLYYEEKSVEALKAYIDKLLKKKPAATR